MLNLTKQGNFFEKENSLEINMRDWVCDPLLRELKCITLSNCLSGQPWKKGCNLNITKRFE